MASPIALSSAEPITAACHEESGVIEQNCCVYASYECMVAGYIIAGPKFSLTATNSDSEGEKKYTHIMEMELRREEYTNWQLADSNRFASVGNK